MSELHNSVHLDSESDEYQVTSVVAVAPTWRDVWAILRGRYRPKVRKVTRLTLKGTDRLLRETWNKDTLQPLGGSVLFRMADHVREVDDELRYE